MEIGGKPPLGPRSGAQEGKRQRQTGIIGENEKSRGKTRKIYIKKVKYNQK